MFQEKKVRQIFQKTNIFYPLIRTRYVCVSGGKKCSFFGKFGVLCFLETPVLRFALLPYYRQIIQKIICKGESRLYPFVWVFVASISFRLSLCCLSFRLTPCCLYFSKMRIIKNCNSVGGRKDCLFLAQLWPTFFQYLDSVKSWTWYIKKHLSYRNHNSTVYGSVYNSSLMYINVC